MRYNVVFSPRLYDTFQRLRNINECLLTSSICEQFKIDWAGDTRLSEKNLLYLLLESYEARFMHSFCSLRT